MYDDFNKQFSRYYLDNNYTRDNHNFEGDEDADDKLMVDSIEC